MLENAKRSGDARAAAHQDYRVGAALVEHESARWRMYQQRIALPNDSMKESGHHTWLNIRGPHRRVFSLDADPQLAPVRRGR